MTDVETDDAGAKTWWWHPDQEEQVKALNQLAQIQTEARGQAQGGIPCDFQARYHPLGNGLITPIPACYRTETKILYIGTPGEPESYEWLINTVLKALTTPPRLQVSNTIRCLRRILGGTDIWYQITLGAREFVAGGCLECEESQKAEDFLQLLSLAFGIRIKAVKTTLNHFVDCQEAIAECLRLR